MSNPVLDAARAKRQKKQDELDELMELPTEEKRELSDDETTTFEELAARIAKLDKQIDGLEAEEKRAEKAASAAAEQAKNESRAAVVTSESMTYDQYGPNSYVRDLAVIASAGLDQSFRGKADDARERLASHRREIEVEARTNERLRNTLKELRMTPQGSEQRVNPNTTDGTGGEFVPPIWLVDQYVPFARAGRVIANRIGSRPLPPGTDSINMPKILTGTAAAIQAAQADPVTSTDLTTSTVTAAVNTIAGQQDISIQLLEQSPINMDAVVFEDLSADYDKKLDAQVIGGTGLNGQHKGIFAQTAQSANSTTTLNTDAAKINAVTCASVVFYDGQATSFTQFRSILNGKTNIETLRFRTPSAIYAHPRRINSWEIASDATIGRPLYTAYGAFNALGEPNAQLAQGVTGSLTGLPVVKDANIPILCATGSITSGSGDMIGLVCEEDLLLWEGNLRMRVLPEVLSGTLQVRLQVYAYSAFMPNRYPGGTTLITGTTGLAAAAY